MRARRCRRGQTPRPGAEQSAARERARRALCCSRFAVSSFLGFNPERSRTKGGCRVVAVRGSLAWLVCPARASCWTTSTTALKPSSFAFLAHPRVTGRSHCTAQTVACHGARGTRCSAARRSRRRTRGLALRLGTWAVAMTLRREVRGRTNLSLPPERGLERIPNCDRTESRHTGGKPLAKAGGRTTRARGAERQPSHTNGNGQTGRRRRLLNGRRVRRCWVLRANRRRRRIRRRPDAVVATTARPCSPSHASEPAQGNGALWGHRRKALAVSLERL